MAKIAEAVVGAVFGQLTVLSFERRRNEAKDYSYRSCNVKCSCGKTLWVRSVHLGAATNSCGCTAREKTVAGSVTHGMSQTTTYKSWSGMWERCTNSSNKRYSFYKDKSPPDRWRSFENFLLDMGECPEGLSLDRRENLEPYSADNCRWADAETQCRNRRSNIRLLFNGQPLTLVEAVEKESLNYGTVISRIRKHGWAPARALENAAYSWPTKPTQEIKCTDTTSS